VSKQYTSSGKRRSAMAHANTPHHFDCGLTVYGNGYVNHRRAHGCRELTTTEWFTRPAEDPGERP